MPSQRIAQRWAKFDGALVTREREFFLTRFGAARVVTECPLLPTALYQIPILRHAVNVRNWIDTSRSVAPAYLLKEGCPLFTAGLSQNVRVELALEISELVFEQQLALFQSLHA